METKVIIMRDVDRESLANPGKNKAKVYHEGREVGEVDNIEVSDNAIIATLNITDNETIELISAGKINKADTKVQTCPIYLK